MCPPLKFKNGWKTSENVTYNSYVEANCNKNYRMVDGANFKMLLCDETGKWSESVSDCDGKYPLIMCDYVTVWWNRKVEWIHKWLWWYVSINYVWLCYCMMKQESDCDDKYPLTMCDYVTVWWNRKVEWICKWLWWKVSINYVWLCYCVIDQESGVNP